MPDSSHTSIPTGGWHTYPGAGEAKPALNSQSQVLASNEAHYSLPPIKAAQNVTTVNTRSSVALQYVQDDS